MNRRLITNSALMTLGVLLLASTPGFAQEATEAADT